MKFSVFLSLKMLVITLYIDFLTLSWFSLNNTDPPGSFQPVLSIVLDLHGLYGFKRRKNN